MRVLVSCDARSRSTLLVNSISAKYNITYPGPHMLQKVQSVSVGLSENMYLRMLNHTISKNTGITKLYSNFYHSVNLKSLPIHFSNMSLASFDLIFLTYRKNHTDRLCSFYILKNYTRWGRDPLNVESNIIIHENDYIHLSKLFFNETQILISLKNYLIHNNISFTLLEYNDVPVFLKDNEFPLNVKTPDIHLSMDYSSIISNYNEVDSYVKNNLNLSVSQ